jgi:hypothetical protein
LVNMEDFSLGSWLLFVKIMGVVLFYLHFNSNKLSCSHACGF